MEWMHILRVFFIALHFCYYFYGLAILLHNNWFANTSDVQQLSKTNAQLPYGMCTFEKHANIPNNIWQIPAQLTFTQFHICNEEKTNERKKIHPKLHKNKTKPNEII